MVRILDVDRLITSLTPELRARLAQSLTPRPSTLRVVTELGESTVSLGGPSGHGADEIARHGQATNIARGAG